jgi:hypothetical protein
MGALDGRVAIVTGGPGGPTSRALVIYASGGHR